MARKQRDPGTEYHRQLVEDILKDRSPQYEWLRARGIKNYTIARWKLGVVRDPLPNHERFRGCVSIPYKDARGLERGLRFRRLRGKPKYDGTVGVGAHMFGVKYTREPEVFVTEGEFDCMVLHQMGYKAVGIPGANAWKAEWRWLLRAANEVVVIPDADGTSEEAIRGSRRPLVASGGAAFKMAVLGSLKGLGPHLRVVRLPEEEDVNSMYLADRKYLKALLEGRT